MCPSKARAVALAARLTAVTGNEAWAEALPERIRIKVSLPARLTEAGCRSLLAVLADADRYGHEVTLLGAVAWAEIDGDGATARKPGSSS
ncbi:hypothetical protein ACWGPD_23290 [Streptomyces hirsutus]|uniref:hypothetical protein n=1 Tax=Streptomyces hirsutus TaxID=35620 RepID=UPI00331F0E9E